MGSKISMGEAYFLVAFAVIADLINWIPLMNWFVTAVTLPAYQFYFHSKGVKTWWSLAGNLGEALPLVSVLPLVTGGVVMTIVMANRTNENSQ